MLPSASVKSPRPRKPCIIDRRMGVRVAQSQQSLPGDQDQDFPLINIVQEQLHRRIRTKIFRVFVLLFPALLETRDDDHVIPGNAPLHTRMHSCPFMPLHAPPCPSMPLHAPPCPSMPLHPNYWRGNCPICPPSPPPLHGQEELLRISDSGPQAMS